MKRAILLVASAALTACTVGPDYYSPTIDLPTRFLRSGDSQLLNAAAELWWLKLNDPLLAHYVDRGNAKNLSVIAALERIRAAEAAISRTGPNARASGDLSASSTASGDFSSVAIRNNIDFGARYVLDLFGGQRRATEQAVANYDAAQFDVGVVRVALVSEIVDAYVRARYFQAAAAITRGTIDRRQQVLGLVQQLKDAGAATQLDVEQARSLLKSAEANLPAQENGFESNVIRLAALIAEPTPRVLGEMKSGHKQPRPLYHDRAGIPANLLRNRPDIRAAERRYAAAVAGLGVAEAELYPSVALNGSIGITVAPGTPSVTPGWSFGPALSIPVFNRGALDAAREVAASQARQAEIAWRQSVYDAVEEVETALSNAFHLKRQVNAVESALVYSKRVLELSRAGYQARETTLTDLLNAEISLANDRLQLAGVYRDHTLAWSQVQVAAGKGWSAPGFRSDMEIAAPFIVKDPLATHAPPFAPGDYTPPRWRHKNKPAGY